MTIQGNWADPDDPETDHGEIRPSMWFQHSEVRRSSSQGQATYFFTGPAQMTLSAYPTPDSGLVVREVKVTRREMPPVEMRAIPRRRLRGKVVDAEGKPLGDVRIFYVTPGGEQLEKEVTRTIQSGDFLWERAPATDVKLVFERPGYAPATQAVPAESSEPLRVRMVGGER